MPKLRDNLLDGADAELETALCGLKADRQGGGGVAKARFFCFFFLPTGSTRFLAPSPSLGAPSAALRCIRKTRGPRGRGGSVKKGFPLASGRAGCTFEGPWLPPPCRDP